MGESNDVGATALIKAAGFFWDQGLIDKALVLAARATAAPDADDTTWTAHINLYRERGDLARTAALCQSWTRARPESQVAAYFCHVFSDGKAVPPPDGDTTAPAPFLLRDNFLTQEQHGLLVQFLDENIFEMVDATVLTKDGSKLDKETRSARVRYKTSAVQEWFMPLIRGLLPDALPRLRLQPFEIDREELQITASFHGDFYKAHRDADQRMVQSTATRRVTYVYYFRPPGGRIEAGHLRVYDCDASLEKHTNHFTSIEPLDNRLIVFRSDSLHEVMPTIARSGRLEDGRFTVNGWLRSPPVA